MQYTPNLRNFNGVETPEIFNTTATVRRVLDLVLPWPFRSRGMRPWGPLSHGIKGDSALQVTASSARRSLPPR